jgi:hypothetical protein
MMAPPAESSKESMIARAETQGELKVIERQLVGIELILQKMHGKLDILSDTIASTNLRLAVLDEKLKDYDNIKKSIADLQDSKTRMTVVFSIGAFVISAITSLLIKLVH